MQCVAAHAEYLMVAGDELVACACQGSNTMVIPGQPEGCQPHFVEVIRIPRICSVRLQLGFEIPFERTFQVLIVEKDLRLIQYWNRSCCYAKDEDQEHSSTYAVSSLHRHGVMSADLNIVLELSLITSRTRTTALLEMKIN